MWKAAGLGDCPRKVFDELSQLRMVDVVLPTKQGVEIGRRCVERPNPHQAILLQRLGMRPPESLRTGGAGPSVVFLVVLPDDLVQEFVRKDRPMATVVIVGSRVDERSGDRAGDFGADQFLRVK